MARHKMPRFVQIVEVPPMKANGKSQKFALRAQVAEAIARSALQPVRR